MTEPSLLRALQESTEEVLEKMFFIQCLAVPVEPASKPEVVAHLAFEGDPSGALTLRVSADAARSVAADFLGAEESELSEQQVGDVVCELANMICGSVLSRVESDATFRLAAPQILAAEDHLEHCACLGPDRGGSGEPCSKAGTGLPVPDRPERSTTHAVEIGKGRIVVSVNTEKPAWSTAERYAF